MSSPIQPEDIPQITTEELVEIVYRQRGQMAPEVVEAAEDELQSRNVPPKELKRMVDNARSSGKRPTDPATAPPPGGQSLFSGPGLFVTILIIVPAMVLIEDKEWWMTFGIALIGFGAGHAVNYIYSR